MHYDKPEVLRLHAADLFSLTKDLFPAGHSLCITVTGNSMYPFMRDSIDRVTLSPATFGEIRTGDIVLGLNPQNRYILHRVVKKTPAGFYMIGDAQMYLDGPYPPDKLVARMTELYRSDKKGGYRKILLSSSGFRFLSRLWMLCRPVRPLIFKVYNTLTGG